MSGSLVDRFIQKAKKRHVLSDKLQRKASVNEAWDVIPEYVLGAYQGIPENLLDAGFTEETLKIFEVGIDRTNDRVVFPIRDHLGRLVAISGRAASDRAFPKYKVYDGRPPDSQKSQRAGELYGVVEQEYKPNNRRHLYGIQRVYSERYHRWKDEDMPPLVITEGYKSTMWLHQLGFKHALGLQGSSLTLPQRRTLSRVRGPYYVMLDLEPGKQWPPDRNGRCSAIKIAKQLRQAGEVYLCRYPKNSPPNTQPDDLAQEGIQAAIDMAELPSKFIMREINGTR
jgi:DNA primase